MTRKPKARAWSEYSDEMRTMVRIAIREQVLDGFSPEVWNDAVRAAVRVLEKAAARPKRKGRK